MIKNCELNPFTLWFYSCKEFTILFSVNNFITRPIYITSLFVIYPGVINNLSNMFLFIKTSLIFIVIVSIINI